MHTTEFPTYSRHEAVALVQSDGGDVAAFLAELGRCAVYYRSDVHAWLA